jgi:bidirectional [NiFe] hydrogenase diaphorase subunit
MVDVARFFVEFCRDESCGKCVPCRAGTVQMHRILEKITRGEGTGRDLEMLEQLCGLLKETSLCGLGQTAPNPVVSTLRYFRDEYRAHIEEKRCPAGVCAIGRAAAAGEVRA